MDTLASEVLLIIFDNLPTRDTFKCREVCIRFKNIIDHLAESELFWQERCKTDHKNVWKEARWKSLPTLSWHSLYKSLKLWRKSDSMASHWHEMERAQNFQDPINGIKVLKNGVIAILKPMSTTFYNSRTMEQSSSIASSYRKYDENDRLRVILHHTGAVGLHNRGTHSFSRLTIIPIEQKVPQFNNALEFEDINDFILVGDKVYYVRNVIQVYVVSLKEFGSKFLFCADDDIVAVSYSDNHFNILTRDCKIITEGETEFVETLTLAENANILHQLWSYNFLDRFEMRWWHRLFKWTDTSDHFKFNSEDSPTSPSIIVTTIKAYGDVIFLGTIHGILRIYHAPFTNGQIDLVSNNPIKEFDLKTVYNRTATQIVPINDIDVIETGNGHMMVLFVKNKVMILTLSNWDLESD